MPVFKNTSGGPLDIPSLQDAYGLEVHVADGETVEIPDELAAGFEASPNWTGSKTTSPTVTADEPVIPAAPTGPPAVTDPAPAA